MLLVKETRSCAPQGWAGGQRRRRPGGLQFELDELVNRWPTEEPGGSTRAGGHDRGCATDRVQQRILDQMRVQVGFSGGGKRPAMVLRGKKV